MVRLPLAAEGVAALPGRPELADDAHEKLAGDWAEIVTLSISQP